MCVIADDYLYLDAMVVSDLDADGHQDVIILYELYEEQTIVRYVCVRLIYDLPLYK